MDSTELRQRSTPEASPTYTFDGIEPSQEEEARMKRVKSVVRTAVLLVFGGSFFLLIGLLMYFEGMEKQEWMPALVLAPLCLVPGTYVSYIAYGAHKKWPGFSWEALPGYQEVMD